MMRKIEIFGALLIILGILILIGYAVYLFVQATDVPFFIRAGITVLITGILVLLLSLVRERLLDIRQEKMDKRKEVK